MSVAVLASYAALFGLWTLSLFVLVNGSCCCGNLETVVYHLLQKCLEEGLTRHFA